MEKMDRIIDREIAWRIFAHEFNLSDLYVSEDDERAPNYIITPTGVKCNRLFIIGVVTEAENIGKDNNLWRARIADPTGVFTIYAGQYQPEAAIFLSELQVPAYVAIVGKARKYEPEGGSVYLSVRPEEINAADETHRDMWVLDTAERTIERIKIIKDALNSGLSGNELQEFLAKKVTNAGLINGAIMAIAHYKNLGDILLELEKTIVHAVETVASDSDIIMEKPGQILEKNKENDKPAMVDDLPTVQEPENKEEEPQLEPKEVLAGIIDRLDTGKGVLYSSIIETAEKEGMDTNIVELSIKELMDEGRCYEPKIGLLRKV